MWNSCPAVSTKQTRSPRRPGFSLFSIEDILSSLRTNREYLIYREVRTLEPVQAAYIAGLVDGEGTVTLSRRHKSENRQLVVSISNTERPLLDYVLEVVGVGKITSKKTYRSHHAPSYTYSISNRQGLSLLKQVQPYLRTYKAKRTALIISNYVRLTPRNGRYTPEISRARKIFEREVMSIKS